jgi:hypothetical protein
MMCPVLHVSYVQNTVMQSLVFLHMVAVNVKLTVWHRHEETCGHRQSCG